MKKEVSIKKDVLILHEKALKIAKVYLGAESDLICVLQEIEQCQGYLEMVPRRKDLYEYATQDLGLSRDVAYNMIAVARKGLQIPALQEMLRSQEITLSNARTIVSVMTPENQTHWLQSAATLSKHDLERAVAEVNPKLAVRERVKPVGNSRLELRLGVSEDLHSKLKHVQDLLSSRREKHATLEDALDVMTELFLEKEDPVRKAERAQSRAHARAQAKTGSSARTKTKVQPNAQTKDQAPTPTKAKFQAQSQSQEKAQAQIKTPTPNQNRPETKTETDTQTDSNTRPKTVVPGRQNDARVSSDSAHSKLKSTQAKASVSDDFPSEEEFMPRKTVPEFPKRIPIPASLEHALNLRDRGQCAHHQNGKRCPEKRWLDFHHVIPIEFGGATTLENLTTLCRAHHRMLHA